MKWARSKSTWLLLQLVWVIKSTGARRCCRIGQQCRKAWGSDIYSSWGWWLFNHKESQRECSAWCRQVVGYCPCQEVNGNQPLFTPGKTQRGPEQQSNWLHLLKCFGYALKQNKDNVEGLRTSVKSIVPHAFGHHENCSSSWCGYLINPSTYTHNSLPHGKDLQGQELESDLKEVVDICSECW